MHADPPPNALSDSLSSTLRYISRDSLLSTVFIMCIVARVTLSQHISVTFWTKYRAIIHYLYDAETMSSFFIYYLSRQIDGSIKHKRYLDLYIDVRRTTNITIYSPKQLCNGLSVTGAKQSRGRPGDYLIFYYGGIEVIISQTLFIYLHL